MASPQIENGYTKIANEIMEKLSSYRLSGEEWQILCVIFRKLYGWGKTQDEISMGQFASLTGMPRQTVNRAIKKLSSKKMIGVIKKDDTQINTYVFIKDYDNWKPVIKKDTSIKNDDRTVIKNDNGVSSKMMHTKETITKERNKDKPSISEEDIKYAFESLWSYFDKKGSKANALEKFKKRFKTDKDLSMLEYAVENYLSQWEPDKSWRVKKALEFFLSDKVWTGYIPEDAEERWQQSQLKISQEA
jgi:phage replication O-like protein O